MRLTYQPNEQFPRHIDLFLDGEFWKQVDRVIFGRRISLNATTQEEYEQKFAQLEFQKAYQAILKRLSLSDLSSQGVSRYLQERLVTKITIVKVIEECERLSLIDDKRWVESLFKNLSRKKIGPREIKRRLFEKGATREQVGRLMSDHEGGDKIELLLTTKYHGKDLNSRQERDKVIASLLRKGFEYEEIKLAIARLT